MVAESAPTPNAPENTVSVGEDGWLFLKKGTNNVASFYGDRVDPNNSVTEAWANLLGDRNRKIAAMGAKYVHIAAPDKLTVYGDKIGFEERSLGPMGRLVRFATMSRLEIPLIDPTGTFEQQKTTSTLLYWKTDTHWTPWGCLSVYRMLCNYFGVTPKDDLMDRQFREGDTVFDLGSRFSPPIRERARFYNFLRDAERVEENALVRYKEEKSLQNAVGLHVGSRVVFRNVSPGAIQARVVVFGDSFAEYRPSLLTGMLAESFCETHFAWSASVDFGYVERIRPDIVITELAERFMPNLPVDGVDLDKDAEARVKAHAG
jgi:alginate O-acetyltransferase complex protein AlgJ